MSRTTRGAVWIVRAALALALGVELLVLHFPVPEAVDRPRQRDVRGAWEAAARVGRAGGRFVPAALEPVLEPIPGDKAAHFLLFLPLGVLAAAERRLHGPLGVRRAALVTFALVLYAVAGELAQVFGRQAEVLDALANALGAIAGVSFVAVFTRPPRARPKRGRGVPEP
ncbi:MAG: VanZ family protein [Sandaracinaceae bacterium]|nr:VanZ family protein [Sandaracinaceae bacterium]